MAFAWPERGPGDDAAPPHDEGDWLTLQQAACELNVSLTTIRRRIRNGELRNRIVPRKGGVAYRVHIPDSRHGRGLPCTHDDAQPPHANGRAHLRVLPPAEEERDEQIKRLEDQVERLSEALSRVLKVKQTALPPGVGEPEVNPDDPYARYRWLVRRRRWWPF